MTRNFPSVNPLDWSTIQPHIDALLAADLTAAGVRGWLQVWSDLASVLAESSAQIYREITENTTDEAADARFKILVQDIIPASSRAEQLLKQKLLAVPDYEPTAETAKILKRFRAEADLFRDENVAIISQLQLLGKRYSDIIGGLTIDWDGETHTIPQAEVLLASPDRNVREQVWRKALAAYLSHRQELNNLYLEMLPLRRQLAVNAGLPNFRAYQWLAMGRFDYTPEDCLTFHDAIEHEVVPLATKTYENLAARLGLEKLHSWDLGINGPWKPMIDPFGEALRPFQNVEDLEAITHRIFAQVDPVFGDYFGAMRQPDARFLDLASRPNKAPGGYCEGFPVSGLPYIFMNAAGSHDNVMTLLHEGGHAFHFAESYRSQSLLWNYNAPLEFCEVASMGMELLSVPYWTADRGGFYVEAEVRRAMVEKLIETVFFLPYMAVMDSFQHWLYTAAAEDVSAADLDAKWSELWDRFLPAIDASDLQTEKETGWHRKGHLFGAPFYYVEYGLAQLGALQVWRNALADQKAAVAAYRHALALGDTRSLPELFAAAGAQFAFDRQTVGELMALVRGQLEQLEAL